MRKRDIILKISEETGIKQVVVKDIVQRTLDVILDTLKKGERIELRNFGVFQIKRRKKRVGRNPKTGEVIPVPSRLIAVFKPGLKMRFNK
jgi:nucleoid DNA-binding protein